MTAHALTATFAAVPTVKPVLTVVIDGVGRVRSVPDGIRCSNTQMTRCQKTTAFEKMVTLMENAGQNNVFHGWSGCTRIVGNKCLVTMDSDKTVTASFITEPSGRITVGKITGFGQDSVIVNGIEFKRKDGLDDNKALFKFDDTAHPESDLGAGMIVTVIGSVDDGAKTGVYEKIEFQPEVRGAADDKTVDIVNEKIKVMCREVQIECDTIFDKIADLAELQAEMEVEHKNPELEISGVLDDKGILHATRISKKAADFTSGMVEIKGTIASAATGSFIIAGVTVTTADAVFKNMTLAGLAAGLQVEVKGTLENGVISGAVIEKIFSVPVAKAQDDVRIQGAAAGPVSNNTFVLNGPNGPVTIRVNGLTSFQEGGVSLDSAIVQAGVGLEIEGTMKPDGSLLAMKISAERENVVKIEGDLAAAADISAADKTIKLNGVTVAVGTARIEDSDGNSLALGAIAVNDHLQISGVVDTSGVVSAVQVRRMAAPEKPVTFIQGPVSSALNVNTTTVSLTVLGVTIVTDAALTEFKDINHVAVTQAAFIASIEPNSSVVKAKSKTTTITSPIDEIELEDD